MLYEQIAETVRTQIQSGLYEPGDRLVSVRRLASEQGISVSTAVQAYQLLEDQGVIEARPQSGYYVRGRLTPSMPTTRLPKPTSRPMKVSTGEMIMDVLETLKDPSLVPLGAAQPAADLLPVAALNRCVNEVLRREPHCLFRYEGTTGNVELREQIARLMLLAGVDCSADEIVITNGGQEAMLLAIRAVAQPGDVIAVESPTYYGVLQAIQSLGMKALEIPTDAKEGMSLDALKLALEQWPIKAVFAMPTCSNPLGSSLSEEKKQALLQLLKEHDLPLIENDEHAEFASAGSRPRAAKHYDNDGRVLLCTSFSKTLAPGCRVGWIVPGRYQEQITYLKYVSNLATPTLTQRAIARFLNGGGYERHVRKLRQLYVRQQERLAQAIFHSFPPGTKSSHPAGGMVTWVELPNKLSGFALYQRALEKGISIVPGRLFSVQNKYEHFIRLSCGGMWTPTIERAIATLGQLAQQLLDEQSRNGSTSN